jgi:signal transduction histidine kinase
MDQAPLGPSQHNRAAPDLYDTAEFLAGHGRLNAVWLDPQFTVRHVVGALAGFVQPGRSIIDSVPALLGHEDELAALRLHPQRTWDIPNVALHGPEGPTPKLDISVLWRPATEEYVVLLGPVLSTQMPDVENLMRGRLIAEEKLRQTTAELERINRDLEEFTYIISHDLKAPLRALKFLSGDVAQGLDPSTLDIDAARTASHDMIAQAKRMSSMLMGLLEYAQLGRKSEAIERTDTCALVRDIIASLGPSKTMPVKQSGHWPTAETLAVPLDLVLRNLISNALKHHDRVEGQIEVLAGEQKEYFTFAVIDDGPGIAAEWQEAIFLPFRTINQTNFAAADASGIGLALVKRATEAVGGHIELSSDPARKRGATFTVFWPKTCAVR